VALRYLRMRCCCLGFARVERLGGFAVMVCGGVMMLGRRCMMFCGS
jgi:hypothetical protein